MKRIKHRVFATVVLLCFSLLSLAEETVTFACNYFPPLKITKPSESDLPGYDVEVINAVMKEINRRSEFEFYPWNRAYDFVKTGKKDALCSCSYLPEREEHFIFSDATGEAVKGVFYLQGHSIKHVAKLDDLKGSRVAVVRGYNLESELHDKSVTSVELVNSDKLLLNLLLYRRVDYIYSYESTIRYELKQFEEPPALHFRQTGNAPYYVCFGRRSPWADALVPAFNSGLEKIKRNGLYDQILKKYRVR